MTTVKHIRKFHFIIYSTAIFLLSCNFSSWTRERALYAGNINGDITIRDVEIEPAASRTSGVAPLSVHFTAGFSNSTSEVRVFHDLDYSWDFGDMLSSNWGTTGKSKNTAKGPVTTHIFEIPGTYTVNLCVKNGSTVIDTESFNIEVLDPDTVYGGTNTTCVNNAGDTDFTGAPSGARTVSTNDLSGITQYATAGSRILFKRGSSWTTGGLSFPNNAGPVTIGAYGTGNDSDALGIFNNAPQIIITGGQFCPIDNKQDWRIIDLQLINNDRSATTFNGGINIQRILFQRLKVEGFSSGLGWSHWNNDSGLMTIDQMVISDCEVSDPEEYCVYMGGERIALLGCILRDSRTTHVARVWQAYQGVISNNIISGSSLNNTNGRHALKLHGPGIEENRTPVAGTPYLANRTQFSVVSHNVFGASGPWPVSIGPADAGHDCLVSDVIFEGNRIHPDYGSQSLTPVQVGLSVCASYVTVRNNIIDGTGAYNGFIGIRISQRGVEPAPRGNRVYNNTIYRQNEVGITYPQIGIEITSTATNTIVMNNLARFQLINGNTILQNSSADLISGNNLLTDTAAFVDPDNVLPLLRNFNIQSGSSAIGQGAEIPVFDDFDGNIRSNIRYDLGALYYTGL